MQVALTGIVNFIGTESSKTAVCRAGLIPQLKALVDHPNNELAQLAISAVSNLCMHNERVATDVIEAGKDRYST